MKLFGKKEESKSPCCGGNCKSETMQNMEQERNERGIKILGSGCAKCIALENATRTAISEMGLDIEIKHITDFAQIASYGVMTTPALVLDGKVVSYGRVLTVQEVNTILVKYKSE
ncbi:MAG: thioredoxin family protein [Anaerostipes sp.]|nr:thioredoxin family protein [Anaerostipes sp.]